MSEHRAREIARDIMAPVIHIVDAEDAQDWEDAIIIRLQKEWKEDS